MIDQIFSVFDTNTLISAVLFTNSKPAQALHKAQKEEFLVCSDAIFTELTDVLMRTKFDKYVSEESRQQFLKSYQNTVLWIDVRYSITDCRDIKDNKFLEAATSANATYLVSGDDDLLVLHPYEGIQILNPADFLLA